MLQGEVALADSLKLAVMIEDPGLSVEAPFVKKILRRADVFEQLSGREGDPEFAVIMYCIAARLGSGEAQYRLGRMLLEGRGVERNVQSAATLFSIAAGNGHERAMSMLSVTGVQQEVLPSCMRDDEGCSGAEDRWTPWGSVTPSAGCKGLSRR